MKTLLVVEIDHKDELPKILTDIVAHRVYGVLINAAIRAEVTVKLAQVDAEHA